MWFILISPWWGKKPVLEDSWQWTPLPCSLSALGDAVGSVDKSGTPLFWAVSTSWEQAEEQWMLSWLSCPLKKLLAENLSVQVAVLQARLVWAVPAGLKLLCGFTSGLVQLVDTLKRVFIIFTLTSPRQAVPKSLCTCWKGGFSTGRAWCGTTCWFHQIWNTEYRCLVSPFKQLSQLQSLCQCCLL